MARNSFNYFSEFVKQASLSKKAAGQLMDMLTNYTDVTVKAQQIHITEHEADTVLHDVMTELNRSFITPIDMEDIVSLANALDDITDSIEDVSNLFDMLSITVVKPEAKTMAELILKGCEALHDAVAEFVNFKNSKKLSSLIIQVNRVEEDGDRMHRSVIKSMFQNETNAIELIKWKQIFYTMEEVLDNCENVADLLYGLTIKNS